MPMTLRRALALGLAVLSATGCTDSTEPAPAVPRELYYVAYTGAPSYRTMLYGAALDGSLPKPVIEDTIPGGWGVSGDVAPWISRDGSEIKVLVRKVGYRQSIATVDPFGELLSIVPTPDSAPSWFQRPSLSPDGTVLAWFADGYLQLANLDNSPVQKIPVDTLSGSTGDVAWSRDGKSVAFVTWHATQVDPDTPTDVRLWTRRLSDGFTRPVATLVGAAGAPAWSRDGRWLTVTAGGSIHRLRVDGGGSEQVVYDGGMLGAQTSSWGPGDSLLAIATGTGVLLLRPDGTGARTLVSGKSGLGFATWRD